MSELELGNLYTISPNKRVLDRSYSTDVWKLIAVNASHAQLELASKVGRNYSNTIIVVLAEHDFSPADQFALEKKDAT